MKEGKVKKERKKERNRWLKKNKARNIQKKLTIDENQKNI